MLEEQVFGFYYWPFIVTGDKPLFRTRQKAANGYVAGFLFNGTEEQNVRKRSCQLDTGLPSSSSVQQRTLTASHSVPPTPGRATCDAYSESF